MFSFTNFCLKKYLYIFLLFSLCFGLKAQELRSVQIFPGASQNSLALIELNTDDFLEVHFDDLSEEDLRYIYEIVPFNADWTPSSMREIDYMQGFNRTSIEQIELSFNSLIPYAHYSFQIPSLYQKITKSGNYKVLIYAENNMQKVLAALPFRIWENQASILAEIFPAKQVEFRRQKQELSIRVDTRTTLPQAFQNLSVYVQQNQNPLLYRKIPYQSQDGKIFEYKDKSELVFDGLSDFRNFDIRPILYGGRNVEHIRVENRIWNGYLYKERARISSVYTENPDINGAFVIKAEKKGNSNTDAEYVQVHFTLEKEPPFFDQKVYVTGSFNTWQNQAENQMEYDYQKKAYTWTGLFKQGFYDYMYVVKSRDGNLNLTELQGNYQEKANDYYIFVYYRNLMEAYDRLIGFSLLNSHP